MGLDFPNPIGLAAGFDKNAEVIKSMFSFGFGFVDRMRYEFLDGGIVIAFSEDNGSDSETPDMINTFVEGYDEVGSARATLRLFVDFAVNFGFIIAIFVAFAILETPTTLALIVSILLSIFNMVVMPIRFNRSMGNVISRTQFINSRGDNATFIYHSLKNTTIASYFIFLLGVFFGISMLGESSGIEGGDFVNAFIAICLSTILIPLLDYIFRRTRADSLGLWEVAFGGIWLVKAASTSDSDSKSRFMQRLESMAEYAESRVDLDDESQKS